MDNLIRKITFLVSVCLLLTILLGCNNQQRADEGSLDSIPVSLKIETVQEGFYEISFEDIRQAGIGLDDASLTELVLMQKGTAIRFWVDDVVGGKRLRFYAPQSTSRHTNETITILTSKEVYGQYKGSKVKNVQQPDNSSFEGNPLTGCFQEKMFEEDIIYQPKATPGESWLWMTISSPGEVKVPIIVDAMPAGDVYIQMGFFAMTEASVSPDHKIDVFLNGRKIGTSEWDGKGWNEMGMATSSDVFHQGNNVLTIRSPGLSEVIADKILLDWVQITVPVNISDATGQARIHCSQEQHLPQELSSTHDVYIRYQDNQINRIELPGKVSLEQMNQAEYWLVNKDRYFQPQNMTAFEADDSLIKNIIPAEYLVIGERELIEAAQPLVEWRRSQGLSTTTIPTNTLFDFFTGGAIEPEAIRSFLYWASTNWTTQPKYVLLIGDATFDPKGYQYKVIENGLPTFLVDTQYGGETASDYGFSIVSTVPWPDVDTVKDEIPEIAIGRLPAQNLEQVKVIVGKIIQYEKEIVASPDRNNKVLVVVDPSEFSFTTEGQNFLEALPEAADRTLLAPQDSEVPGQDNVIQSWQDDPTWIVYFGHGSIREWGSRQYLSTNMLDLLPDQQIPPIVVQFTCLSGLFTHPEVDSLSEGLLWDPKGGAIALVGPTSLTLPGDQSVLSQEIANQIGLPENRRLGDVLLAAWQSASRSPIDITDVIRTFVLLGDPALLLR